MKNFALVGVGGFIAPRHLKAIKETNNNLLAALDLHDSVGVIDSYFPEARFFTEFERFDRHIDKLTRIKGEKIDYISICSPNYLHDAHSRYALRAGANAICEKPLVLNPWNIDGLAEVERHTGKKIFNILQLRLHPTIIELKSEVMGKKSNRKYEVELTYITPRGRWYFSSWKGQDAKSGGVATNIGVHFFDMLQWLYGKVQESVVHFSSADTVAGYLELEKARVRWFLSVNASNLVKLGVNKGPYRSITIDGDELEFSAGFTDLHTQSYQKVLAGEGFGIDDVRTSIEIVSHIRNAVPQQGAGDIHPLLKLRGAN